MNTTRMPGFSAEASLYRSSAHYQVGAMLAGLRQGRKGIIHPALPRYEPLSNLHCTSKVCCLSGEDWHICWDLGDEYSGPWI